MRETSCSRLENCSCRSRAHSLSALQRAEAVVFLLSLRLHGVRALSGSSESVDTVDVVALEKTYMRRSSLELPVTSKPQCVQNLN